LIHDVNCRLDTLEERINKWLIDMFI
jgi:hypothetical protein